MARLCIHLKKVYIRILQLVALVVEHGRLKLSVQSWSPDFSMVRMLHKWSHQILILALYVKCHHFLGWNCRLLCPKNPEQTPIWKVNFSGLKTLCLDYAVFIHLFQYDVSKNLDKGREVARMRMVEATIDAALLSNPDTIKSLLFSRNVFFEKLCRSDVLPAWQLRLVYIYILYMQWITTLLKLFF